MAMEKASICHKIRWQIFRRKVDNHQLPDTPKVIDHNALLINSIGMMPKRLNLRHQ